MRQLEQKESQLLENREHVRLQLQYDSTLDMLRLKNFLQWYKHVTRLLPVVSDALRVQQGLY